MDKAKDRHHKMLDKSQIVRIALEILKEEGYESITIRNIAVRLNIKSASLYWHIKNKDELLGLVADEICKEIQFPDETLPWDEQLMQLGHQYRARLLSLKDSAVVLAETPPVTPYRIQLIKRINTIFEKAGMNSEDAFSSLWLYNIYVTSFILEEYRFIKISEQERSIPDRETQAVPPINLTIPDMDREFQFGLETLIAGLERKINK